jgi:aspartate-semialdehyde dehydrogenase
MREADQRERGAPDLAAAPGVKIVDDRVRNYFPMPIDASGQDDVLVGRIRQDLSDPSGIRSRCSSRRISF